jgi:hypothetical protein
MKLSLDFRRVAESLVLAGAGGDTSSLDVGAILADDRM